MEILFEDASLLAISKEAGQVFHSEAGHVGVVESVRNSFPNEQLYPVHRLDRMTSGLMLFAKGEDVNRALSMAFQQGEIEKYYLGISARKPSKSQGRVSGDMSKSRGGSYILQREQGKPAVTYFFSRAYQAGDLADENKVGRLTLFLFKPETGRTHQLRVAAKALGAPLLGDTRYGAEKSDRAYLHAYRCRFKLNGQVYDIQAPTSRGRYFLDEAFTQCKSDMEERFASAQWAWPKRCFFVA